MNRLVFALAVCISLFSAAKAQVSLGVKAGGALTALPGGFYDKSKLGIYGGAAAGVTLKKSISLQAELYYSQQGGKMKVTYTDENGGEPGEGNLAYRLNYINLPVLIQYHLPNKLFVETGLQAGLLLTAKVKGKGGSTDLKDDYKSFDLSLPMGIGYPFENGLGINMRYNLGLTNVLKTNFRRPHNSVIQLGLFYNLKK